MPFSEIVYKVPGKHPGPEGKTYDYLPVTSKGELKKALEEGWYNTLDEAINVPEPVRARNEDGVNHVMD